jgi:hypothetical protein
MFGMRLVNLTASFGINVVVGFTEEILFTVTSPANAISMAENNEMNGQVFNGIKK